MQTQTEAAALTNREKGEKTSKLRKKIPAGKISVAIFIVVMLIYPLLRFGIMWGYINIRALWTSFTRYDLMTATFLWEHYSMKYYLEGWRRMNIRVRRW